ncbi:MAG TPA: helix-hairpin-helix domain-containing protein [Myxococcota bacterium]|nr:helix-hairpin-helix domain-containing protein [Myxococcota bacterium]
MSLIYWLNLLGFVFLLAILGAAWNFRDNLLPGDSACHSAHPPHPFLCGMKIKIQLANVEDLSHVDGISRKKAEAIHSFFQTHRAATIDDLLSVKGLGAKTLARLKEHFH